MRVLGVDPGTVATGWGVIDAHGQHLAHVSGGVIRPRGALGQRLARIHEAIERLLTEFTPTCISLETPFVGENVQSAFRLGEARGAILVAAAQARVPVQEYSPAEIKLAVVGSGRAAKEQIQLMVARLLALPAGLAADEADALGAAICHVNTQRFATLAGVALPVRTRRPRADRLAWERVAHAAAPTPPPVEGKAAQQQRARRIARPARTGRG